MRRAPRETLTEMNILVVDDEIPYLEMTEMLLRSMTFSNVFKASSAEEALRVLEQEAIDMVLTDVNMAEMDGIGLLRAMKERPELEDIPVIMISGNAEMDLVVDSLEYGAEDYLRKPIKEEILWARVVATLERKYLRDQERRLFEQVELEKRKSEAILYNLIPEPIVDRLRRGERNIADVFPDCTVLFADIVGFTDLSSRLDPSELVEMVNNIFHAFDGILEAHQLEKIKTNGDNYILVGGLPPILDGHAERCVQFAKQAIIEIQEYNRNQGMELQLRIGLNTGPVVAGVVGKSRFSFDMWGDTVNLASRMECLSLPNKIHLTNSTRLALDDSHQFQSRGQLEIKGKGKLETFFLS